MGSVRSTGTGLELIRSGQEVRTEEGKRVRKKGLVNTLNRINFQDGVVHINMRHRKYDTIISLPAKPLPCLDDTLECVWQRPDGLDRTLAQYEYHDLFFSDGFHKTEIKAELDWINTRGIGLVLPEISYEINSRLVRRHGCVEIDSKLNQSSLFLQGRLSDFSAVSFAVDLSGADSSRISRLNPDNPVNVTLEQDGKMLYSETCRIVRLAADRREQKAVLTPFSSRMRRQRPKQQRSVRQVLTPLPTIDFIHPITGKKCTRRALDISGSGISVEEDRNNSLLLPGLVIPEMSIRFANDFRVRCRAQVLFNLPRSADQSVKCGLVFLDMNAADQVSLASMLHQARNEHSYVGVSVDLDALWDFFFETGFIYPEKYVSLLDQKERFKELYYRLYSRNPEIARHVIYQDKGVIYGHVSMFRFYRQTWLMHHHAAIKSSRHKAGLVVMDHILQYINEVHNIPAARMKYIACYFRPKNKFANRTFGGAARALGNQKHCSLDAFAYYHYPAGAGREDMPEGWMLRESTADDFENLELFYNVVSGGLMLEGLDLYAEALASDRELSLEYEKLGFQRGRLFVSLQYQGELTALFVVNVSDLGLNMSDLTNCIQVFVLDGEALPPERLENVLGRLSDYYPDREQVPVLLYPSVYADNQCVAYEKIYELTVLDLEYLNPYLEYMENLVSTSKQRIKKFPARKQ